MYVVAIYTQHDKNKLKKFKIVNYGMFNFCFLPKNKGWPKVQWYYEPFLSTIFIRVLAVDDGGHL